jgi:hypothetical protein
MGGNAYTKGEIVSINIDPAKMAFGMDFRPTGHLLVRQLNAMMSAPGKIANKSPGATVLAVASVLEPNISRVDASRVTDEHALSCADRTERTKRHRGRVGRRSRWRSCRLHREGRGG